MPSSEQLLEILKPYMRDGKLVEVPPIDVYLDVVRRSYPTMVRLNPTTMPWPMAEQSARAYHARLLSMDSVSREEFLKDAQKQMEESFKALIDVGEAHSKLKAPPAVASKSAVKKKRKPVKKVKKKKKGKKRG
jgi:hypothetical protein